MSMKALTRSAVEVAFAAAGDLIASVAWQRPTSTGYNPASGKVSQKTAARSVRAVEDKVTLQTKEKLELSAHAVRLWIPIVDFEKTPAIKPDITDQFIHRGILYRVRDVAFQGTDALAEVHGDI